MLETLLIVNMKPHYLCTLTLHVLSLILPLIHSLLFVLGLRFESIFHRLQFCGGLFEVVLIPQNFHVPFLFVCGNCSANNVCVNSSFLAVIKDNYLLTITFPASINPNSKPIFELFDPLLLNFRPTFVNESAIWFQLTVRA